jgi:type II secretory pathway component GspD/PulD (secretin)
MKISTILAALICLCLLTGTAASAQPTNKLTTGINFVNAPLDKVLEIYAAMSKKELVIADEVRGAKTGITLQFNGSPEEVPHLIEQAVLKQAGVVITRLDEKRVSVTYKDRPKPHP